MISSWTSGKNGEVRWWGAWRHPGKNHSSRRLWEGSSGGDPSKPSSSTALDRTLKISVSMPGLDVLGCPECKGAGSWYEPDSSSASEAANDRLSSISLSSLPPNETRLLAAAEGCWFRPVKRMGENSLWGEKKIRFLSEKKSSRERREERLTSPQWWHSVLVSDVSARAAPKHETHSPCLLADRGALNFAEKCALIEEFS